MMNSAYGFETKEVIRIKVKKCDGLRQPEYKRFCIDPQITSFEMLHGILSKAFEIDSDFTMSYLAQDAEGQEVFLTLLSDWDLDAAFQCAADPCLRLKVDLNTFGLGSKLSNLEEKNSFLSTITNSLAIQMGKTVSSMQRIIGLKPISEPYQPSKPPMSDMEFHGYLDSDGVMVRPSEFRLSIFQAGIESSLRRVAWRHLLSIFPEDMSGRERFQYLKRKEQEYLSLRDGWMKQLAGESSMEELKHVVSMVRKDVLRTDRAHRFYAGGDDCHNVISLFHLLVTYAVAHPKVSYCQGMSDLASPLLVVQIDEAQAYVCFCGLMARLQGNFSTDGRAMSIQFQHLAHLLQVHDMAFYDYLDSVNAKNLFFCYRWMLLQLKREFPFDDALYMFEVMWSTLPPSPPEADLPLADPDYDMRWRPAKGSVHLLSFHRCVRRKVLGSRRRSQQTGRDGVQVGWNSDQPEGETGEQCLGHLVTETNFDLSPLVADPPKYCPIVDDANTLTVLQGSCTVSHMTNGCRRCAVSRSVSDHTVSGVVKLGPGNVSDGCDDHSRQCWRRSTCGLDRHVCRDNELPILDFYHRRPSCCLTSGVWVDGEDLSSASESGKEMNMKQEEKRCFLIDSSASSAFVSVGRMNSAIVNPVVDQMPPPGTESLYGAAVRSPSCWAGHLPNTDGTESPYGAAVRSPSCWAGHLPNTDGTESPYGAAVRSPSCWAGHLPNTDGTAGVGSDRSDCASHVATSPPLSLSSSALPPPQVFGNGNPFLVFLCLSLLLQHRDRIMSGKLGYVDVAMLFDKMMRRNDVAKVLHLARELYTEYLLHQQTVAGRRTDSACSSPNV